MVEVTRPGSVGQQGVGQLVAAEMKLARDGAAECLGKTSKPAAETVDPVLVADTVAAGFERHLKTAVASLGYFLAPFAWLGRVWSLAAQPVLVPREGVQTWPRDRRPD